jgi:hypothetical protein
MRFYWLALGMLVTWRITHLLQAEDGPWNSVVRLRRFAGEGFWGGLIDCFYCLSVWVAAPLALWIGEGWRETVLLWPAMSAGAILLERITAPAIGPADYVEDALEVERERDGMLRSNAAADANKSGPPPGA